MSTPSPQPLSQASSPPAPQRERDDGLVSSGSPTTTAAVVHATAAGNGNSSTDPSAADHLVVVSHGLWGTPLDVAYLAKTLGEKLPHSIIFVSRVNSLVSTYHGIDVCGTRLVKEIKAVLAEHNGGEEQQQQGASAAVGSGARSKINKISFIGYSAGGLFNRYAVGLLHNEGFFTSIQPVCFITMATPHLGCRELPLTAAQRLRNGFLGSISDFYCGRSGQQMMLIDGPSPLLLEMSLDTSCYYKGLSFFPHIYFYANASRDNTVNYITASISETNRYKGMKEPPPTKVPGSRWRYVVDEALVGVEEEEERVKKAKEEDGREPEGATMTTTVVTEAAAAVVETSVYDQSPISPVVLPLLAPLVVVHAVVLMTPLRIISSFVGEQVTTTTTTAAAPESSTSTSSSSTSPSSKASKCRPQPLKSPARAGASASSPSSEPSAPPSSPTASVKADDVPALIRQHLKTLPIRRVDVFLPGMHTHGSIVVRRSWDTAGVEVIDHLAEKVDGHVQSMMTCLPHIADR